MKDKDVIDYASCLPEASCTSEDEKIRDSCSVLKNVLSVIQKWEIEAENEMNSWYDELRRKNSVILEYSDPINETAPILAEIDKALYGSLAVNIAAKVENELARMLESQNIEILKNNKNIKSSKPHFDDYLWSIKIENSNLKHKDYIDEHYFIRELGNRFKHSGGKSTRDFFDNYGKTCGIVGENDEIPYETLPWGKYIDHTVELLIDLSGYIKKIV